ncbi:MAG: phosphopantothenoylcysteine decarboxylase [Candidatus Omnitrophota bacterium]
MLAGKKILVTAGPTWVAIDRVRVLGSIFTGRTGCVIARKACDMGAQVKVLLGPGSFVPSPAFEKKIEIVRFHYFEELLSLMRKEASAGKYDAIIHSAAVADYTPENKSNAKIPSGKSRLTLKLKPTVKIIQKIKQWGPGTFLVQFKLEVDSKEEELINIGYKSMLKNQADIVVVNDLNEMSRSRHGAFIVDQQRRIIRVATREGLAAKLLEIIAGKVK